MTVNVLPPIVRVPVREVVAGFAATVYAMVPLPEPDAPEVIVIQVTVLAAVQAQVDSVVRSTVPVVAAAPTDSCRRSACTYTQASPAAALRLLGHGEYLIGDGHGAGARRARVLAATV